MATKKKGKGIHWVGGHSNASYKKIDSMGKDLKKSGLIKGYEVQQHVMKDARDREGKITVLVAFGGKYDKQGRLITPFRKQLMERAKGIWKKN